MRFEKGGSMTGGRTGNFGKLGRRAKRIVAKRSRTNYQCGTAEAGEGEEVKDFRGWREGCNTGRSPSYIQLRRGDNRLHGRGRRP